MFPISKQISVAVRKKRAVCTLSKSELCELLQISHITLSKIESGKGKINKKTYQKIVNWLLMEFD